MSADQECYSVHELYRGTKNVAENGEKCQTWPLYMANKVSFIRKLSN